MINSSFFFKCRKGATDGAGAKQL